MSNQASTDEEVNTLAQINDGLSPQLFCTAQNFTQRILESCLEASDSNAIFFIWCSLEQALEYLQIHKGGELAEKGLTAVSYCMVNGKKRITANNEQLPSTTGEFFVVVKKGQPAQTTFDKWGAVYSEEKPRPKTFPNDFRVPTLWWDSVSNQYPFEKPKQVMRMMVNHFARPGQLVFEGFAGTISCGLAALACGVSLVAVDNNPDTEVFLQSLYNQLNLGLNLLEDADGDFDELPDRIESHMFVTRDMEEWPKYELYCPDEWIQSGVEVSHTEQSPFLASNPVRSPNFPSQPSQSSVQSHEFSSAQVPRPRPIKRIRLNLNVASDHNDDEVVASDHGEDSFEGRSSSPDY